MIEDVPSAEDFYDTGKGLLGFSWDVAIDLLKNLKDAEYFGVSREDIGDEYWKAAKRQLVIALSVAQQGVEFLLKGRIAAVSPFLLLSDAPSRWPSPYDGIPLKYSRFRTIDAQDLPRVHDSFSQQPLSSSFLERFEDLRETRNRIMHSVDKSIDVEVIDIIDTVLFVHQHFFPGVSWVRTRREYVMKTPEMELGAGDFVTNMLCREMLEAVELLKPAAVKAYFQIDKKQRRYFCAHCMRDASTDMDFLEKLAVLTPKGAESTHVYCVVCEQKQAVLRKPCKRHAECPGNVIDAEDEICLTCGQ